MIRDHSHSSLRRSQRGFTIVELMYVLLIIGILVAFAYPSYLNQVRQSKRAVAKNALLDTANREEQYFFDNKNYTDDMKKLPGYSTWTTTKILFDDNGSPTTTSADAIYEVSVVKINDTSVCGSTTCFKLKAEPKNDQVNDACYTFTLTSNNAKGVSNSTSTPASECW